MPISLDHPQVTAPLEWRFDGGWESVNGSHWFFLEKSQLPGHVEARAFDARVDFGDVTVDEAKVSANAIQEILDNPALLTELHHASARLRAIRSALDSPSTPELTLRAIYELANDPTPPPSATGGIQ